MSRWPHEYDYERDERLAELFHRDGQQAYADALKKARDEGYTDPAFRDSYAAALMTDAGFAWDRVCGWVRA